MIVFTCPNCNRVSIVTSANKVINDIQCKCEATYRLALTQLHEGKKQNLALRESELAYTYDSDQKRITLAEHRRLSALRDLSRSTIADR